MTVKPLTKKFRVHAQRLGKVGNLVNSINAILHHELPKTDINTGDESSIKSWLFCEILISFLAIRYCERPVYLRQPMCAAPSAHGVSGETEEDSWP